MYPTKKLSEICKIIGGGTPSKSNPQYYNGDILWASVRDMKDEFLEDTELKISEEAVRESSTHIIPAGNVIIATRVGLGKVCLNKSPIAINQDLKGILPKDTKDIDVSYLFWWFKSISRTLENAGTGATVKGVKVDFIENLQIPLPPLSTQSKIVAKLDEAFDNIDSQISLLKANIEDVENMRKSALSELFSGNYQIKKLQEVCEKITDGTHQTPTYFNSGYIFLSSKNVTSGKIDWNNIKYIDERQHQEMYKRVAPRKGDILLAKNGTTGVAAIVDRNEIFDIYVSLALIRPKDEIISEYLWYFINSSEAKRQFNSRLKGVGVPNLHLGEIKEVDIPLPPLPRQHEIVEHLDRVFTQTAELRSSYEAQIRDLETLRQSLLEEAFAGRLVSE